MTILSIQIDSVGQSGVSPKFIYVNTTNSIAQVTTAGFLNTLVAEGIPIGPTDIAVVITKESSQAQPATNLYTISIGAHGLISLTEIAGGHGTVVNWQVNSSASIAMQSGVGYISTNAGAVTASLPASAIAGQVFGIAGMGAGLFTLNTPLGSTLSFANAGGNTGQHIASSHVGDNLQILCVAPPAAATLCWVVISSIGPLFNVT